VLSCKTVSGSGERKRAKELQRKGGKRDGGGKKIGGLSKRSDWVIEDFIRRGLGESAQCVDQKKAVEVSTEGRNFLGAPVSGLGSLL